jgi:hypothetical protein
VLAIAILPANVSAARSARPPAADAITASLIFGISFFWGAQTRTAPPEAAPLDSRANGSIVGQQMKLAAMTFKGAFGINLTQSAQKRPPSSAAE